MAKKKPIIPYEFSISFVQQIYETEPELLELAFLHFKQLEDYFREDEDRAHLYRWLAELINKYLENRGAQND